MANEFFVRRDGRDQRFAGGKSRFLQEADGGKGVTSAAAELCGIALNGVHVGVLYMGNIYCNIHPYGLPEAQWISDFNGVGVKNVSKIYF